MKLTEEQKEIITNCGTFGYDCFKISILTGISLDLIEKELNDTSSEMSKIYEIGKVMFDYFMDKQFLILAKNGDIEAYKFLKNKRK